MIKLKARGTFFPTCFEELYPILKSRRPFLILDRDGTLVPFHENPSESTLDQSARRIINRTAQVLDGRMAIISARSLSNLSSDFDSASIILAGNYGMEISCPTKFQFLHPAASQSQLQISGARAEIERLLDSDPGLILDDHLFSLCLHFHKLPSERHEIFHASFEDLKRKFFTLSFRRLSTSYEIVPLVKWDKSNALDKIADALSLHEEDLLYIAFGDSLLDEPLFTWSNERHGLSFLVGNRTDTHACGSVDHPDDVIAFLDNLNCLYSPAVSA